MSLAINVQSSVTKRFYQEVVIRDKQSIWRFEFRCAAAQKLRSVCKRALRWNNPASAFSNAHVNMLAFYPNCHFHAEHQAGKL